MEDLRSEDSRTLLPRLQRAYFELSEILAGLCGGNPDYGAAERSVVGNAIGLLYEAGQISLDMSMSARARMVDGPGPASEDDIASLLLHIESAIIRIQAADRDGWPDLETP